MRKGRIGGGGDILERKEGGMINMKNRRRWKE